MSSASLEEMNDIFYSLFCNYRIFISKMKGIFESVTSIENIVVCFLFKLKKTTHFTWQMASLRSCFCWLAQPRLSKNIIAWVVINWESECYLYSFPASVPIWSLMQCWIALFSLYVAFVWSSEVFSLHYQSYWMYFWAAFTKVINFNTFPFLREHWNIPRFLFWNLFQKTVLKF